MGFGGKIHLRQQLHGLIQEVDAVGFQEVAELLVQAGIARGQAHPGLLVGGYLPQVLCAQTRGSRV